MFINVICFNIYRYPLILFEVFIDGNEVSGYINS